MSLWHAGVGSRMTNIYVQLAHEARLPSHLEHSPGLASRGGVAANLYAVHGASAMVVL